MMCHPEKNTADFLSRLTKIPASRGYVQGEEYVLAITLQAVPVALRIEEIEKALLYGEEFKIERDCL